MEENYIWKIEYKVISSSTVDDINKLLMRYGSDNWILFSGVTTCMAFDKKEDMHLNYTAVLSKTTKHEKTSDKN